MSSRWLSALLLVLGAGALGAHAAHAAPPPPPASMLDGALCRAADASECETSPSFSYHRAFHAGPRGASVRLANGATLRFEAGASFSLGPTVPVPTGQGEAVRGNVVVLHAGRAHVNAGPGAAAKAVVFRGPRTTSALVRTGLATLRAHDEGIVLGVGAGPGAMIAAGNAWAECDEATVCAAPGKHAGVSHRPAPEAPAPLAPALAGAVVDGRPVAPTLRWRPSPAASHYDVGVFRSTELLEPLRSFETRATEVALAGLNEVGTYWAAARTVDADGIPGPWCAPVRVRVAGVETPKGAIADATGAIQLPEGARLRLSNVEGLLVGTEGVREEFAAPADLGVGRGSTRPLRLREPGGDEGVPLRLVSRHLRLAVDIGPKTAHWPEDNVTIRVRLADGEGRPLPEGFALNVDATFDLQPVALRWSREADAMVAAVPPRVVTGPGVLRAEVTDGHGLSLGRGSLEIVPSVRVVAPTAQAHR